MEFSTKFIILALFFQLFTSTTSTAISVRSKRGIEEDAAHCIQVMDKDSSATFAQKMECAGKIPDFAAARREKADRSQLNWSLSKLLTGKPRCYDLDGPMGTADYGCHQGYCWAYCWEDLKSGAWCYTSKDYKSFTGNYVRCSSRSDCCGAWACGGACALV